ncbi:MAG: carbohydrate-binding protein [Verrucomicrobiales bacterium]|jgi:hypothetical protein|nr:carbohydrate-binding protein [Verrucomicrobiales bacterium]
MKPAPVLILFLLVNLSGIAVAETKPFSGEPSRIPGLIEAEHWDKGEAGVAYSDTDEKNLGEDYREPTQVDIEKRPDASNGHGLGWTRPGEWLLYTVEVLEDGIYTIEIPVASKGQGGTFHLKMDGKDVTGPITIPDTGSWQTLVLLKHEGVELRQGTYTMKLEMTEGGPGGGIGDIDYFKFLKS